MSGCTPVDEGPNLDDYVLRGHRTERWAVPAETLEAAAGLVREDETIRYRARVILGTGDPVRSKWQTYPEILTT